MNPILERYVPLVEYIGQIFGEYCEVILHDLTNMEHSIVAIANQQITGREVGGHITDFGLEVVHDPKYVDKDFAVNYRGTTPDGTRTLKSSTFFIRDDNGDTIGLLCINLDITDWLVAQRLVEGVPRLVGEPAAKCPIRETERREPTMETFTLSLEETLHSMIDRAVSELGVPPHRLTTNEKKNLVITLHAKGTFTLKGAVSLVAKQLDVSEQTVYRYLREAQEQERQ